MVGSRVPVRGGKGQAEATGKFRVRESARGADGIFKWQGLPAGA